MVIPNQSAINAGNYPQQDLSKFRNITSSGSIPIADYSMSEKIEISKSEKSITLIKAIKLVSFKQIPILIKRLKPLPSININLRLFDANLEHLVSKDDSSSKSVNSNLILNLAFTSQSQIINPLTEEFYTDWTDNPIGTSGTIVNGNLTSYDPFKDLNSSVFSDQRAFPDADGIFRMATKIYTAKDDKFFFEISANTPFNYLDYPSSKPYFDQIYTKYFRIGRNIILSYFQNKNSTFVIYS